MEAQKVGPSFGITLNRRVNRLVEDQKREARRIGCDKEQREKARRRGRFFLV
jgi:hypothetical protein